MFNSAKEAAAYLSGVIDGEGSVRLDFRNGCKSSRISVWNTDLGLLNAASEAFKTLGASPRLAARKKASKSIKQPYVLEISNRKDIEAVAPHLTLHVANKAARLVQILEAYVASNKTPRHLWPTEQVKKYLETHTQREAAAHFSVSQSTIQRWAR